MIVGPAYGPVTSCRVSGEILVSGQEGYASADFIVGIVMGALSK